MRSIVTALVALVLPQSANTVTGVVDDAVTRLPVADARVLLARVDGPLTTSIALAADDRGRFAIRDVPAGTYRVFATRDGYLRGEANVPLAIAAGQAIPAVLISLTPTAVITGRVVSEFGDPVPNAYVRASIVRVIAETKTNDLGEYRLFDLGPGSYVISAERYTAPYREQANDAHGAVSRLHGRGLVPVVTVSGVFQRCFIDPRALARESSRVVIRHQRPERGESDRSRAGAEISVSTFACPPKRRSRLAYRGHMTLTDQFRAEMDREAERTREVLARVPTGMTISNRTRSRRPSAAGGTRRLDAVVGVARDRSGRAGPHAATGQGSISPAADGQARRNARWSRHKGQSITVEDQRPMLITTSRRLKAGGKVVMEQPRYVPATRSTTSRTIADSSPCTLACSDSRCRQCMGRQRTTKRTVEGFRVDPLLDKDRVANQHVFHEFCRDALVAAEEDEREHAERTFATF